MGHRRGRAGLPGQDLVDVAGAQRALGGPRRLEAQRAVAPQPLRGADPEAAPVRGQAVDAAQPRRRHRLGHRAVGGAALDAAVEVAEPQAAAAGAGQGHDRAAGQLPGREVHRRQVQPRVRPGRLRQPVDAPVGQQLDGVPVRPGAVDDARRHDVAEGAPAGLEVRDGRRVEAVLDAGAEDPAARHAGVLHRPAREEQPLGLAGGRQQEQAVVGAGQDPAAGQRRQGGDHAEGGLWTGPPPAPGRRKSRYSPWRSVPTSRPCGTGATAVRPSFGSPAASTKRNSSPRSARSRPLRVVASSSPLSRGTRSVIQSAASTGRARRSKRRPSQRASPAAAGADHQPAAGFRQRRDPVHRQAVHRGEAAEGAVAAGRQQAHLAAVDRPPVETRRRRARAGA